MTQSHVDAITGQFIENEGEPAHFRALSLFSFAFWYNQPGPHFNRNTSAELLRLGLDIIAASPKEDESRQVLHRPHITMYIYGEPGPNDLTLKRILGFLDERSRQLLTKLCSVETRPARVTNSLHPIRKAVG
jgi:hypothetical protein